LEIERYDVGEENATLKGDYVWQVVAIGIGGIPTALEVGFLCLIMTIS
jgi:hypothetical protein